MACRETYHLSCHYVLPAFWGLKPFNTLLLSFFQEFAPNLMCVDVSSAPLLQHSPRPLEYVEGKENWFAVPLFYSLCWILSSYCLFGFEMLSFWKMSICLHRRQEYELVHSGDHKHISAVYHKRIYTQVHIALPTCIKIIKVRIHFNFKTSRTLF